MLKENPLKQYGIDPWAESIRLSRLSPYERQIEFKNNLEAYTNEVIEDKPVSIPYHYWCGQNGEIYTDSSQKPIYALSRQFDLRERGGLALQGTYDAIKLAHDNPYKTVCLYSPAGPASFDADPDNPYTDITYTYGQLYVMYSDNEKINAVGVKVNNDGILLVEELMPHVFENAIKARNLSEVITTFIQSPVILGDINSFLNTITRPDLEIYKNNGKTYRQYDVLSGIQSAFFTQPSPKAVQYDRNVYDLEHIEITETAILNAYLSVIYSHMQEQGQTSRQLSGSCGGNFVTRSDIEDALGIHHEVLTYLIPQLVSGFSSTARLLFQGGITQKDKPWEYHDGTCVVCKGKTKPNDENTKVGPCEICKICEKKFD